MRFLHLLSRAKIGTKITLLAICPVLVALAIVLGTVLVQNRRLAVGVEGTVRQQAVSEASKIAQNVSLLCGSTEARNQRELTQSLSVAHDLIVQGGGVGFASETVPWQAVDQITKQASTVTLPRMTLGARWIVQITAAAEPAGFVDEVRRLTGNFCTIFQRMNETGDMLRVSTSVLKTDGARAIGTVPPGIPPVPTIRSSRACSTARPIAAAPSWSTNGMPPPTSRSGTRPTSGSSACFTLVFRLRPSIRRTMMQF